MVGEGQSISMHAMHPRSPNKYFSASNFNIKAHGSVASMPTFDWARGGANARLPKKSLECISLHKESLVNNTEETKFFYSHTERIDPSLKGLCRSKYGAGTAILKIRVRQRFAFGREVFPALAFC